MTSVQNINLKNNPPVIIENIPNRAKKLSFGAEKDTFVKRSNAPVITEPPMLDQAAQLQRMLAQQKKEQKKQKTKQNLTWGISIASGLAIITMVVMQLKAMKGGAKEQVKEQMDDLAKVAIDWIDMKGQQIVPSLSSKTTAPGVQKQFTNFTKRSNMSPKKIKRSGSKTRAKLILLHGPSGTGKTFSTQQLAQDQEAIYACIKYSDIASPFKDAASMKISNCLEKGVGQMAEAHPDRPIVFCIDEADTILRKVNDLAQGAEEAGKSRGVLLAAADNVVNKYPNVTIVFTTNYNPKSGQLSKAAIRRIPYKIEVGLPDKTQADALAKMYLKDCEGIPSGFYESKEYTDFIQKLVDEKYGSGEIKSIMDIACDNYLYRLENVADSKVDDIFFEIKDLKDAKDLLGRAVESIEGAGH